jgi:hypothetical protein
MSNKRMKRKGEFIEADRPKSERKDKRGANESETALGNQKRMKEKEHRTRMEGRRERAEIEPNPEGRA